MSQNRQQIREEPTSSGPLVSDKHPLCLAFATVPAAKIPAPESMDSEKGPADRHQLHPLQGQRVFLAVGLLIWPNLAQLLRKQPFGKLIHPDVTFQEPLLPDSHSHSHAPSPSSILSQKSWGEARDSQQDLRQVISLLWALLPHL